MTRALRQFLAASCLLALPALAAAQVTPASATAGPDDTQAPIRVGAVIFYDYTYTMGPKTTDAAGNQIKSSQFNVARAYINITGGISHRMIFRITPDIARDSTTGSSLNGSLIFRIKYAYAQVNLDDWTGKWRQTWVRLGIQQTPYIDAQEGVYRYRFQGTVFVERDGGLNSADAGATFHTNFPKGYGDFHTGFYNGEGSSRAEVNDQKSFQIRATVRPMPTGGFLTKGFRATIFHNNDHVVRDAERKRTIGGLLYEHPRVNAGFDYLVGEDRSLPTATKVNVQGWSVFFTPFFQEKGTGFEMLIRHDEFKPNKANQDQTRKRNIVGLAYWFPHPGGAATAALMLDFEHVKFAGFPPVPANATQQRIALHGLINF